jgi:quinoprotein glucose dehydrogenase
MKKFRLPEGLQVELFAAEPHLANPVAFCVDEKGRFYVAETFRLSAGVMDIRGRKDWPSQDYVDSLTPSEKADLSDALLNAELSSRSVADRIAMYKKFMRKKADALAIESERISLIEDQDGDGKADRSSVFAEGFNRMEDGLGAGVLARKGDVYFTCIPDLWLLRDTDGDGVSDTRKSLSTGYGVRVGFLGHDLHGLRMGPDGRLYFSNGDRGAVVRTSDGRTLSDPDTGVVYRCNPDGTELEVFARGLRNPQELVFDQYGNLWTGDNNSDSGDKARWVYLVEGGDSGWRVGYQFMERPYSRGAFNAEKLWYPHWKGQAAYIVPPIANLANGPSGLAYNPGTGLPAQYAQHFFLVDFRGGPGSRILSFGVKPKGASFEVVDQSDFLTGGLPTDVDFGVDGGIYWTDWVQGWDKTGKGRIYRVHAPNLDADPLILETKRLIGVGMTKRPVSELTDLLAYADMRVRQEAQFELASRALSSRRSGFRLWNSSGQNPIVKALVDLSLKGRQQLARLHAVWGLGQITREYLKVNRSAMPGLDSLLPLLQDPDPELRSQTAKLFGEAGYRNAFPDILALLRDSNLRVRFHAAMSAGKLAAASKGWSGAPSIVSPIFQMLRENDEEDPYLRHAAVMALVWNGDWRPLVDVTAHPSVAVRIAAVVSLRRLKRPEVARFLKDSDPKVVVEAARAINDVPIPEATGELAAMLMAPSLDEPALRRAISANFHLATDTATAALASFAARSETSEAMRVEALEALAEWAKPMGRDRVTGLWRSPLPRDISAARHALEMVLNDLLQRAPEPVKEAAVRAVSKLGLTSGGPALLSLVTDNKLGDRVRKEALKGLATLQSPHLGEAVRIASTANESSLREEATRLQAQVREVDTSSKLLEVLRHGTIGEKQAALESLASLPDPKADDILTTYVDQLNTGKVEPEIQLDLLEAAGRRESSTLKQKLAAYLATLPKDDPLAEYRFTFYGGNATAGQKIFTERAEASCVRCHKINGEGGEVGPDLTGIGTRQTREYLLASMLQPNRDIAQGFETLIVTLKDGTAYAGIVRNEDSNLLVINSPEDGLVQVKKTDIQSRDRGLSPMPEGLGSVLSKKDLRDLVEFLASLK